MFMSDLQDYGFIDFLSELFTVGSDHVAKLDLLKGNFEGFAETEDLDLGGLVETGDTVLGSTAAELGRIGRTATIRDNTAGLSLQATSEGQTE